MTGTRLAIVIDPPLFTGENFTKESAKEAAMHTPAVARFAVLKILLLELSRAIRTTASTRRTTATMEMFRTRAKFSSATSPEKKEKKDED